MRFVFYILLFSSVIRNTQYAALNNVAPLGLFAIRAENLQHLTFNPHLLPPQQYTRGKDQPAANKHVPGDALSKESTPKNMAANTSQ